MNNNTVRADIPNNRLYISVGGKLSREILDNLYTDIRFCVSDLQPGFNVITDLTECTLAALNGVPTFKKITSYLIDNRVGIVVRVINTNNLVFKQFLNLTAKMQGYKAIFVSTIEDAEEKLIQAEKRQSLRFQLNKHNINFLVNDEMGEGFIYDISTGGCAIELATMQPIVGDEIIVTIPFDKTDNLLNSFNANARVIHVNNDYFSVQFNEYDEELEEDLWNRLVYESNREIY